MRDTRAASPPARAMDFDKDFAAPASRLPFRRPAWPFRTRAWRRVRWLLLAPLLALLLEGTARLAVHMVVDADPNDHAIVWVQGAPRALAAADAAVRAHRVLPGGRRAGARAFGESAPAACPGAEAFVFSRLHPHELQIASRELRTIAQRAGARPCGGDRYVFNDVPALGTPGALVDNLLHAAWLAGVPMLAVLVWPWGLGERLALPRTWDWAAWRAPPMLRGLACGLVLLGLLWALRGMLGVLEWPPPRSPIAEVLPAGPGSALFVWLLLPFLGEVAYRGWALPLATMTLGPRLALAVPALLAAAVTQAPPQAWPGLALLHVVLGLLMQRTGSLWACVLAHALVAAGLGLLP